MTSSDSPSGSGHRLTIDFTGSGSEYFRIWIVNLLLTFVTVGFYYPWAKVRRLRYFYGNTLVGGQPLDFHGNPRRMLRGFLLVGAMVLLYSLSGKVSPTAGLIAFVIVAGVWPALFRASQQFRLANTSWRGLRFRFTGDVASAYVAVLPLFAPGLLVLIGVAMAGEGVQPANAGGLVVALTTLPVLLFPWVWWMLKRYQHSHSALGQVQPELRTGPGSFYLVFVKTIGVSLLALVVGMGIGLVIGGGSALFGGATMPGRSLSPGWVAALVAALVFAYGGMALLIRPYAVSRLQNLTWGRTACAELAFESRLRFWPLVGLTLKNWLLILVTLGFYWPFAAIAMARMRLQAVSVQTAISPDELVSQARPQADDATGDAAGDLFGIDIGL
ncbi:DUF898 family protein [soil metagenome]